MKLIDDNEQFVWNEKMSFAQFRAILDQYKSGEISIVDAWWLLGYGAEDIERKSTRKKNNIEDLFGKLQPQKYLININNSSGVAHIWVDGDTVCRMHSTGGLKLKNYAFSDSVAGREVCRNCIANVR